MANAPGNYSDPSSGGDTGSLITEQVKQGAQQALQQSQDAASQAVQAAQSQAQSMVSERKNQMTGAMRSTADALHQTGDSLRSSNQAPIAGVVDTAADKVGDLAGYFEQRDIGQIVGDAERYTRTNAAVVLGGAFLLGLATARFLKSSNQTNQTSQSGSGYGYGSTYPSGYGYGGQYATGFGQDVSYGAVSETYPPESAGSLRGAGVANAAVVMPDLPDAADDLSTYGEEDGTTSGSY